MPPAYQGHGYSEQPGQGHGGDQGQLYQQQQQMYSMRAAGYMPQMGALPRQPYPTGQQYGLSDAPPRYPSASAMCRPSAAATAAAAAVAGGGDSAYDIAGVPAPVHHHLRNARVSQNPQLIADNILHMASATYPCNGPQVIPPGITKFHTPRMASPKHMMSPDVQMTVRQPMGATSGQFDMNHMSPTSGKGNPAHPASQMWPNADGCCSGPMPHQMSPHMVAQQDSCYGNQFHYGAKSGMMSPDSSHMMSPDAGHMIPIRSPSASIHSGHSIASTSPGPMCSPAAGSLCSPHTDQSPASIASPALRSPAGVQSAMMHGMQHGSPLAMGQQQQQQSHHYMPTDQYPMYPPYNQPYHACGQPTSASVNAGFSGIHQSNPLQSLQKLVMLPESQVVNPKSVVSEACLSDRGDSGGMVPPPGKRKRCMDGVHCGSEDENEPFGQRNESRDSVYDSLPDASYFHDAKSYNVTDPCRKRADVASESPTKPPGAKRKQKPNKKGRKAPGQEGIDSVSLAPNLNCSPVAGTGQPEGSHSHAQKPDSVSQTQADTHTHIETEKECHSVADANSCGDIPDSNTLCADRPKADRLTNARNKQAVSNCVITSTRNSGSPNGVKGDGKAKKSRSKKVAKSMQQQCQVNVYSSKPCGTSPTKNSSVKEGACIRPGECAKDDVTESANKEHHENGAKSTETPVQKQECDSFGCGSELGDTTRKSPTKNCGRVECDSVERISAEAVTLCCTSVEEVKVNIKQTTICSSADEGKVKTTAMTGVSVEEGKMRAKGKGGDQKVKVGLMTDCVVTSGGMTKCGDTKCSDTSLKAGVSAGKEGARSQSSVSSHKVSSDSPSRSLMVRMSSPKPMRPQQVDLTKIGKDTGGKLPKTSSRRPPKNSCVEGTRKFEESLNCKNGDLFGCDNAAEPEPRTAHFERSSTASDGSKSGCTTRDIDQKPETFGNDTGTLQTPTSRQKNSSVLLESGSPVKNTYNGLFTEKSNCKTSVVRTNRKRRRSTEKQTAGVKTNPQRTMPTKQILESPVMSTNSTKKATTNLAEESTISDEDGAIHLKRESTKKVYGRSPDKKNVLNSDQSVSTSADEKTLPSDEVSSSNDGVADHTTEEGSKETEKTLADGTAAIDESFQDSGRGKRKRVPNRYFNFGGEVVWWEVPPAFKRKRLHKAVADNNGGKTINQKEPCVTKVAVDKLRTQKADIVKQVLQTPNVSKRTKNGVLKELPTRTVDSLSIDDELPLSVLCKKKPIATVLPLNSVQTDRSPRKCIRQKQMRQLEEKPVTQDEAPMRQKELQQLEEKGVAQDEPPTCIDIVTLVTEEPPDVPHEGSRMDCGSEKELDEMEVEEVEEEEYVLCPDTCQTLDLFIPDALDNCDDKRSEMEVIDCDSDSEKLDMDAQLEDAAFSDECASPSQLQGMLADKPDSAIYIISSDDEREPTTTDTTEKHKSDLNEMQLSRLVHQKVDRMIAGQTTGGTPKSKVKSQDKDRHSGGSKARCKKKKSKRNAFFDYNDDDSADERLKNQLTKAFSGSQSGKASRSTNKDRGSLGGHSGPYVHLKGCKETPILCEVVSLASDDLEKSNKHNRGKSQQGHKHSTLAANLSFKLIDSEPFICAFCGKGSCYRELSDLFGPYHPEGATEQLDVMATSKRNAASGEKGEIVSRVPSVNDDLPAEMWMHEDCAVWSSGVYLVGSKLHGLDEAVTVAQQTVRLFFLCAVVQSDLRAFVNINNSNT